MTWSLLFFTTNIFLGIGLAMDAFSVSMANGLNEPHMNKGRVCTIAGVFGGFQALMPLIGWFCVHTIAESFHVFEKFIPWIALILLLFIGGKMLIEGWLFFFFFFLAQNCFFMLKNTTAKKKYLLSVQGHCLFKELPLLSMRYLLVLLSQNITGSWLLLLP